MLTGQVFVSHTSELAWFPEGRSFVQAALDGVGRAGMAPVDMRYFAARDGEPAEYCRQRVRECEVYVAVVGFRYGSLVPGEEVSYTELEFREAGAAGLPRLVFLLDRSAGRPDGLADPDRGAVEAFRQRLLEAGLMTAEFASPDGLELAVFHALTELGAIRPSGRAGRVVSSLPADTAAFTGRGEQLAQARAAAIAAAGAGRVVAIHAIDGMPGVGKTTLAVHIGHLVADQFPSRQLFVDLRAHTPGQRPADPADVLAALLAADGVDPRYLPGDLDGRAAMWRDRMAGQRALLILDNAASSDQVAPLLPGAPGCLVLVTSRRYLGDLPSAPVSVPLDTLPAGDAATMFAKLAPRAGREPGKVAEMVALCGYLPLAISLLASVFTRHRSWDMARLIGQTEAKLLTVKAENRTVAAAFELSYQYLPARQRRFFRHLGLNPGDDIDPYAAAALTGLPLEDAAALLDELLGDRLLAEPVPGRYRMHNLIHEYARRLAAAGPAADARRALERLFDYYQHTGAIAEARLARQTRVGRPTPELTAPPAAVPELGDSTQALTWARAERANLVACLDHATREAQPARVIALTAALAELLRRDGPWTEAIARHAAAVQAARRLGDRLGQAGALSDLGAARRLTGDYPGAAGDLEQALAVYRDLGHRRGQANALSNLGNVRRLTSDFRGAAADLEQAVAVYRDLGDRRGQADALLYRGAVRRDTGDYPAAAGDLERALAVYRDLGDRLGQANALLHLGNVQRMTSDYPGATGGLEQALAVYRDLGDRLGQANALLHLGAVRRDTGDYPAAAGDLERALAVYRDLGDRLGQANALRNLGAVRRLTGDFRDAAGDLEQALAIYRDLGHRRGQANALNTLGTVRRDTGDYPAAAADLEQAVAIYRGLGDRGGEATALNETGTLHRISGEPAQAEAYYQQALELAREIGSAWDEAYALAGLGRCAAAVGQSTRAEALLRQAHVIFHRIGAADAPAVRAELNALTSPVPRE